MARLVMCGWETGMLYELSGINNVQNITTGGAVLVTSGARNGNYAIQFAAMNTYSDVAGMGAWLAIPLTGNPSEIYMRFGVKLITGPVTPGYQIRLCSLYDGATAQIHLLIEAGGALSVYRGATLLGNGGAIGTGWEGIEVRALIHGSTGVVQVWQNGILIINFTGNTLSSATAQITTVALGCRRHNDSGAQYTIQLDDLAINNTAGSVNNGRIGQGGIFALRPTADTGEKDWTPSTGVDNYARVNSVPPIGDNSYVSAANSGDLDLYELPNLAGGTIDAVAAIVVSRVASGAGRGIAPTLRSGAVTAVGSPFMLTNTYTAQQQLYEKDPNTDAAWTLLGVNSAQCGVTVVS